MYLEGKSVEEMVEWMGLSEDKVNNILNDLDSPEIQNVLSYQLAVKYGKNGLDCKEYLELIEAKRVLVQQGVLPKDTLPFITNMTEFSQTTGLGPGVFVPAFGIYYKFASIMTIRTYQDLQKRKSQSLESLEYLSKDVRELEKKYELLTRLLGHKDN